jgi:hypothetical protein
MADSPFPSKTSDKRPSLAEMAARAAQRTSRPPPAPSTPPSSRNPASMAPRGAAGSYAPPPASFPPPAAFGAPVISDANGSGLINLNHISQAPTLAPAVRPIDPGSVTPATPVGTAAIRGSSSGSRMVLAGVVVALVGIGVAYGLTSQNGSDAPSERAAALSEAPAAVHANPVGVAPPSQPKAEAPAPAAEKPTVNTPPAGPIVPAEATEIARNPVSHAAAKSGRVRKPTAATNGVAAAGPSPGAAAIAAAVAAEAPAPAHAAPAHPPAPAAAPAPAAPEPTGLAGAIKKAVGPTEPTAGPEKADPKPAPIRGDIPDRPAQGAVTGALGAPRAAARNCLVGQEAPSRATIVFASTGKVQSVTVSGPAAGTPADACIKTALSKTVVGAFKEPTSSITVTITPP